MTMISLQRLAVRTAVRHDGVSRTSTKRCCCLGTCMTRYYDNQQQQRHTPYRRSQVVSLRFLTTTTTATTTPVPSSSETINNNDKVEAIFQKILWLDLVEVHLLTELLKERTGFAGVSLSGVMNTGGASATSADGQEEEKTPVVEEKTVFELKLVGFDAKAKIKVIKEVRAIAGLGLKEAKELVEAAPTIIQKDLKREKAEELQKKLEEAGATIEIV